LERLREWRREEAQTQKVPAYVVFHDRTLQALAATKPATLEALLEIPGLGPAKLERYGGKLLEVLEEASSQ